MTGSMVNRATSDLLIGPDWALNVEICDVLNHDPGLAKDVARGLKKRIRSRNPKVQLLALTLLETMIRSCGDIVHMHVAEKDLPHEMVKIVRKKPDFHVKEKILEVIDTWQEALGGSQARHPQVYAAYQELLRAGAVFPQRRNRPAPMLTPHGRQGFQRPDYGQGNPGYSADADPPLLSLTEIQNACEIMDVLSEMLNIINPGDKEGLKQEVVVDLVKQCRTFRQRVVHLVNTTADEDLLCRGLALNDDLQRVLAKHDSMHAGTATSVETPRSLQALVDIDDPAAPSADGSSHADHSASTSDQPQLQQLLLPAPPTSNGAVSAAVDPFIDLLSGEDLTAPAAGDQHAIVPVSDPVENSATGQNALALLEMYSQNTDGNSNRTLEISSSTQSVFPAQQSDPAAPQLLLHQNQLALYSDGGIPNSEVPPQYEQAACAQDAQLNHTNPECNGHQQRELYGVNEGESLPPPPWETQFPESSDLAVSEAHQMQGAQPDGDLYPQMISASQLGNMHQRMLQNIPLQSMHPGLMQSNQLGNMHPGLMQSSQQAGIYSQPMPGGMLTGYTYSQQAGSQFYDQRQIYAYVSPDEMSQGMSGLSMRGQSSKMAKPNSSYIHQPRKPSQEDQFFGDLLTMAKTKQK